MNVFYERLRCVCTQYTHFVTCLLWFNHHLYRCTEHQLKHHSQKPQCNKMSIYMHRKCGTKHPFTPRTSMRFDTLCNLLYAVIAHHDVQVSSFIFFKFPQNGKTEVNYFFLQKITNLRAHFMDIFKAEIKKLT